MKDEIVSVFKKWALIKYKRDNQYFYYFINDSQICGTKEELLDELKYWRDTVDKNNDCMLEIENYFIEILEQL